MIKLKGVSIIYLSKFLKLYSIMFIIVIGTGITVTSTLDSSLQKKVAEEKQQQVEINEKTISELAEKVKVLESQVEEFKTKENKERDSKELSSRGYYDRTRKSIPVLSNSSTKSYMDYAKITNKTSPQYKFIKEKMQVHKDGFLRDSEGYIGVALGSALGTVGDKFEFVLDTGIVLKVVIIDRKADKDTHKGFYHKSDGSVIEFVVNTKSPSMVKNKWGNGLIWSGNFNNCNEFKGKIAKIYKIT